LEVTCQRCHEPLREDERYCSACGLPQLTYAADEAAPPQAGVSFQDGPGNPAAYLSDSVVWRPALKAALILAIPAGVLAYSMTTLGLFWMVGAAAWAVALYAKRIPPGWLTVGVGARIGLITGFFASWFTIALDSTGLWISRFVLHEGGKWDSMWLAEVHETFQRNQQMVSQMGMTAAQAAQYLQISQFFRDNMLSIEGRAGWALSGLLLLAVLLIPFATVGGIVGARFLVPRPRINA